MIPCDGSSDCRATEHEDDCCAEAVQARWCDEHGKPWLECDECRPGDDTQWSDFPQVRTPERPVVNDQSAADQGEATSG